MFTYVSRLRVSGVLSIRNRHTALGFPKVWRFPILLGSSLVVGGYFSLLVLTDREQIPEHYPDNIRATFLRRLPLNTVSKMLSWFAGCYMPTWLRPIVLRAYATAFGCDLTEIKNVELTSYSTISEFFVRELADGTRPVDADAALVSPADGQILHFGSIDPELPVLEQVKGVSYSLKEFLGPTKFSEACSFIGTGQSTSSKTCLYQCVIYLGPGDCHRFYSPTDWIATTRRHFPGKLISVHPHCASRYPGLYTLNERVVYLGKWFHGFMSFGAVAAVGVGGIRVQRDPCLSTNDKKHQSLRTRRQGSLMTPYDELLFPPRLDLQKGEEFGFFTFGSTIVLIFEAPSTAVWSVQPGDRVRIGQSLLTVLD